MAVCASRSRELLVNLLLRQIRTCAVVCGILTLNLITQLFCVETF